MTTGVNARRLGGGPQRRPRTFADGRICAADECETIISKYNSSDRCFNHSPAKFRRLRGVAAGAG